MSRLFKQESFPFDFSFCLANVRGVVLPLFALVLVALLMLAGLGIDAGNLYRRRIALQKAADAAVIGGLGYTISAKSTELEKIATDSGFDGIKGLIEKRADEIFQENLRMSGLVDAGGIALNRCPNNSCFTYNPNTKVLQVAFDADVDLLLMNHLPVPMADKVNMPVRATARRAPMNLSLVFDVSGSMGCPDDDPACNCKDQLHGFGCESLGKTQRKIDTLVKAVQEFIFFFDSNDILSIVPFSMRGDVVPTESLEEVVQQQMVDDDIIRCLLVGIPLSSCAMLSEGATVGSNTNVCDALVLAFEDLKGKIDSKREQEPAWPEDRSYLVFTDGPPTAGRFMLTNPTNQLPVNNASKDPRGNVAGVPPHDYIHYSIYWAKAPGSSYESKRGPSLLVKTQALHLHWAYPNPPAPDLNNPGSYVPVCHEWTDEQGQVQEEYAPFQVTDFHKVFSGCINDFSFRMPHDDTVYSQRLSLSHTPQVWERLYYQCAVAMSDVLRRHHGTVYTVGVGTAAPLKSDPYQYQGTESPNSFYVNNKDVNLRIDVFLARLANDYKFATNDN
jgi:hypothetical protein